MTRPGLIDRQGLLNWADTIGARSELPRLIRRLILETGQGVARLGFPAGEGVSTGGWDGTVNASTEALYVPEGLSLWELSVNKSPGTKADDDYGKRTTTPDGSPPADCTYVAVSLRPWVKRGEWARDRTAEGRWKQVCALGVDDVETWLESGPVTHAWLSEQVGLHPQGLVTGQTWWEVWSSATDPAFPPSAVTAGRDDAVAALRAELDRPGQVVTIRGSSPDEVLAIVAALGVAEASTDGGDLFARTVFVDGVEAWRRLREHQAPLVIVARTNDVAVEFAAGTPHVLVVPRTGTSGADIELPPIDSLIAAEVLAANGVPERLAGEVGKLARLSLLAARRRLARKKELHEPVWAESPASKTVRRAVLIGRWQENSEADRNLVENAVGTPYDDLREEVAALCAGGDPLLTRLGGTIGAVSHFDAWLVLRGELRKDDLEAFHDAVRTVLSETDPRLELPKEDRWRAALFGKERTYSHDLRHGLATTLALLGCHGERTPDGAAITGSEWAGWIVREVLEAANADAGCDLWTSIADILALLAESAPTEFLEAVRIGVSGDTPVLRSIFGDSAQSTNPLSVDSAHPSLLWALETCSWSPEHFGLVIDLLARLAEIDPGGRLLNRPLASLVAILLPWYPQNSVSVERRLAAIDGLRDRHREVAWKLLLALLPQAHGVSTNISEPRFRDWKPEKITVTHQEHWVFVGEIYSRVLTDVDHDPARWPVLIEKIDDQPADIRSTTLARLGELSGGETLPGAVRSAIWEALRSQVARHRKFATADWALPEVEVAAIETTAARFEPTDPMELHAWLFKQQMPESPELDPGDNYSAYEEALDEIRGGAAAEIADSTDWNGLRNFALSSGNPWILGAALAKAMIHGHEASLLQLFESSDQNEIDLAAGYFSKRFRSEGWSWLEEYLSERQPSPVQAARLLLCSHDFPRAWEVAEEIGPAVARILWRNFRTYGLGADFAHVDLAAERLLEADRPGAALALIGLYTRREGGMSGPRAEFVAGALEALLEREPADSEIKLLSHHDLTDLFQALDRSELARDRLARLEWSYLPVFGHGSRPAALSQMLSEDPSLFVDVIRSVYRPREGAAAAGETEASADPEPDTEEDERRATIASNGLRLLSECKTIPGRREGESVDAEALEAWVAEARRALGESGHLEIGDVHIGHLLAWGPDDEDGSRVCLAVRDLLEKLQNPDIEDGLRTELYNSRGVTTRGPFDGGDQERELATKYSEQAERFSDRWPRTATILRRLAGSYERDARRNDEDAERRRKGFDT